MQNNLSTVQQIYACFGQGDVPGILARLADNVRFVHAADPAVAPFGGTFDGKDGVTRFFMALGQNTQTTHFETSNFRTEDNRVINDVQHDGIVPSTNKSFIVRATFTWTFNEKGEATGCITSGDFESLNAAMVN